MVSWSSRERSMVIVKFLFALAGATLSIWKSFLGRCYRVVHRLFALELCLQLLLHIKVQLSLALDSLLFHIADDTFVHGLSRRHD